MQCDYVSLLFHKSLKFHNIMRYDTICSFIIHVFWLFSFHMVTKASFCIVQQAWSKAIIKWQGSASQTV